MSNMNATRRAVAAAPLCGIVIAMTGCAAGGGTSQVLADARAVVAGLRQLLPALGGGTSPLAKYVADAETLLNALAASGSGGGGIVADATAVLQALAVAGGLLPPPYNLIAGAVAALLPVLAAAFAVPVPAAAARAAPWPAIDVAAARKILGE